MEYVEVVCTRGRLYNFFSNSVWYISMPIFAQADCNDHEVGRLKFFMEFV